MENKTNDEMNLKKLFTTIKRYKWLIMILIFLSTILMALNLYFTPSVYLSTSILEKTKKPKEIHPNILPNSSIEVAKDVELLKTFSINSQALKKVDFRTKFYLYKNYKEIEIFKNIPLKIDKIEILDKRILNKKIVLSTREGGYSLRLESSLQDKFFYFFKIKKPLFIDSEKIYRFKELVDLKYFKMRVNQEYLMNGPISFKILGDYRMVYDKVILKNLTVTKLQEKTPLISISYTDTIPQRADSYIDALSKSFIKQNILLKNQQSNKIKKFIDEQLNAIRSNLKKSENRLENYQVSNKIVKPSIQAKSFIEKLSNVEIKISENQLKKKLVNNLILFTQQSRTLDSISPSLIELKDMPSVQLVEKLQNLQMQEDELKIEYTDRFPKLISLREKIYYVRQKILENINNLKRNIIAKSSSLQKEKKKYEKKLNSLPTKEKKILNIQRDYEVSSKMYNYLLKKKTENQFIQVSTISDYRIIDKAHTLEKPIKPKRILLMIVAPLIGLLLGIILAIILQGANRRITNKKDIKNLTNNSIYGIIPKLTKRDIGLEVFKNPHSIFTESYRSIRNNIEVNKRYDRANIICISSLISGEGKTTIVANLSAIFQLANYKSIILSLDLRQPTLENYFKMNKNVGMSNYLNGTHTINEIIFRTQHDNLHIISSGPLPINPSELLLSERLPKLLNILKSNYDYIFIDSAPIGLVSDTLTIMKYTDLNLFVLKENFTEKGFIEDIENILEKNKIKNNAFILNASLSKITDNNYGYGYSY